MVPIESKASATMPALDTSEGSKLSRWGWYLFDFANSILVINGGLYFPEWITKENNVSDFWFNATIVLSSALVLVCAPILGNLFDRKGRRTTYLLITSLMMFSGGLAIVVFERLLPLGFWRACLCLGAFAIIMCAYQ